MSDALHYPICWNSCGRVEIFTVVLAHTFDIEGYTRIGKSDVMNSVYQGEVQLRAMGEYFLIVERTSIDGVVYNLIFKMISKTEADMSISCGNCTWDSDGLIRIKRIFR